MLIDQGYIDRVEYGNGYNYIFAPYTNFEPFTYDFLYNEDLNFREKSHLASVQQYMKIDEMHYGKILFTNYELADRLNISYDTLMRIEEDLIQKAIMSKINSGIKDLTGYERPERLYKLDMIGQGIVYQLKHLSKKVDETVENLHETQNDVNDMKTEIDELKKRIKSLEYQVISSRDKLIKQQQEAILENIKERNTNCTL